MKIGDVILLLRPKQWVKNLLIFAAIIFSKRFFDGLSLMKVTITFLGFCALSSASYILNDLLDLNEDRGHPWKSSRPLASGKIKVGTAIFLGGLLLLLSLIVAWILGMHLFWLFGAYFVLQLGYSLGFKHVVLVDVIIIACGFVMRAISGGLAISVEISNWLLLCTFLLALFLALAKRRQELILLEHKASDHRRVLAEYSAPFIDALLPIVIGANVVAYALYTVSPEVLARFHTNRLIFTFPFVIYGLFRYLYLLHQKDLGDNPTLVLFTDHPLQIDLLLWLMTCFLIIYL